LENKLKVYVYSLKGLSTLDFVDKDSIGHPCVTSRHGDDIFSGFKHVPTGSLDGYLTDEQIEILNVVNKFCKENGLEYEVIDIANLSFISKMKLMFRGTKAPTISFKGGKIEGVPTKADLKALIAK